MINPNLTLKCPQLEEDTQETLINYTLAFIRGKGCFTDHATREENERTYLPGHFSLK